VSNARRLKTNIAGRGTVEKTGYKHLQKKRPISVGSGPKKENGRVLHKKIGARMNHNMGEKGKPRTSVSTAANEKKNKNSTSGRPNFPPGSDHTCQKTLTKGQKKEENFPKIPEKKALRDVKKTPEDNEGVNG